MKKEIDYMWEKQLYNPLPQKDISKWETKTGPIVISRNKDGTAKEVKFQLLVDNHGQEIFLLCQANQWQRNNEFKFAQADNFGNYYSLTTDKIKHNDLYKLIVNGEERKDPAAYYFTEFGDCVFFDFSDPKVYKMQYPQLNTIEKSLRILQTDIFGLIYHWKSKNNSSDATYREGTLGKDIMRGHAFKFILESKILEHIKELGFNAIQFLPFAQSIDGENWKFRYLVVYHFA